MNLRRPILLVASVLLFSFCKGHSEPLDNAENEEKFHTIKKSLQPNVTKKCHSVLIYEEVLPPTIIESDEPTDIILQNLTSEMDQAEVVDAEGDGAGEGLRQKRRAGRIVVRVCNRRRRRRCRYVIVVRGRRGRRRY